MSETTTGLPTRDQVPVDMTWDLTSIFKTDADWESSYKSVKENLPKVAAFKGRLKRSGKNLVAAYKLCDELGAQFGKLSTYASMRYSQDTANATYQAFVDRVQTLGKEFSAAIAYMNPEILSIKQERIEKWLTTVSGLKLYAHRLDELNRARPHIRSAEVQELLAHAAELCSAPGQIRDQLCDADLKFPTVKNLAGQEEDFGEYNWGSRWIDSVDRGERQRAFETMFTTYGNNRNAIGAMYAAQVKGNIFQAQAQRYPSAVDAALGANNIPVSVYKSLVETVGANLDKMDRYLRLKKRILGISELHWWDLYVPMIHGVDDKYTWEQGKELVLTGVAPLGTDYVNALRTGMNSRWVDVLPNKGKSTGAYSSGTYLTQPFILMNWQGTLDHVFTLAHEDGHSMHSLLTRKTQPYAYGDYTIFLAEIASTCNEALLRHHLLSTVTDKNVRRFIINKALEDFRNTLFRQTLFAEFELEAHALAESGEALTPDALHAIHNKLNEKYYGRECVIDDLIGNEWMRIPHFFNSFYVYQYATGMSAAVALSKQILEEGEPARKRYLQFLSSGSSDYSMNLLKKAGVDLSTHAPIQAALDEFGSLLSELEASFDEEKTA